MRVWTAEEKLATVAPERGPVGQDRAWEYIGTNYLLLGLIMLYRSVPEAARSFDLRVLRSAAAAGSTTTRSWLTSSSSRSRETR